MHAVDTSIEPGHHKSSRKAAKISLAVSAVLMLIKFYAYRFTESTAILSDAMESIVNVVAAVLVLSIISYAVKPPDENHPYGHGKVECFSAAFEGGMISFAAVMIAWEAIEALLKNQPLRDLDKGLWLIAFAGVINLVLGIYLKRAGEKNDSPALRSSGEHVISDFWTSLGVIVGLLIVYFTGISQLDAAIAIVVSFFLALSGAKIIRRSFAGLTDETDEKSIEKIQAILRDNPQEGLIQFHHVRLIRSGSFHHIDAHVVVPEFWKVDQCHDKTDEYARLIVSEYSGNAEVAFHVDPCKALYCRVCDLKNCPIRREQFTGRDPLPLDELLSPTEPERYLN